MGLCCFSSPIRLGATWNSSRADIAAWACLRSAPDMSSRIRVNPCTSQHSRTPCHFGVLFSPFFFAPARPPASVRQLRLVRRARTDQDHEHRRKHGRWREVACLPARVLRRGGHICGKSRLSLAKSFGAGRWCAQSLKWEWRERVLAWAPILRPSMSDVSHRHERCGTGSHGEASKRSIHATDRETGQCPGW